MTVIPFRTDGDVEPAATAVAVHLGQGGLLAYPTETVYGLGSRAHEEDLVELAALKGRGHDKPFLLLVASLEMAESLGLVLTPAANALAERFWPGPLTLVLGGAEGRLPDVLRGPEGGIAVRWTSHRHTAELICTNHVHLSQPSWGRDGAGRWCD
jgi:L-threonylcarbamoyladenylate synthase